ncbi:prenyltransferase/squalene oxidase repeat-containing protein [Thermosulfurimonas sp. F29]|uniref:prenyltransferase/squalene oxidase repeat-containing protein n=1 Tax=Thermosulfurimonas sp. F29 TaxID=2867247 RepID=UPI001C837D31|nr:prenyltransferase/squalene oxidase repeat-containing protein [Thermosulfurimonas sp. F29]MBX6422785.1 hypothetical protein [Thermosulfurimonas sp. F29]
MGREGGFLEEIRPEIHEFLVMRAKEEGGFAATPRLPATVEDTYFALRTWELLFPPSGKVLSSVRLFLEHTPPPPQLPALRRWLWLADRTGILSREEVQVRARRILLGRRRPLSRDPEVRAAYYFCVRRLGLDGVLPQAPARPALRTLRDLYRWSEMFPESLDAERLSWVLASRNPDGGFGFRPGTTSFLENTYFALRVLERSGRFLADPDPTLRFIRMCYRRGGFARAPGGIPFLESTYYGVYLLARRPALEK